MRRKSSLARKGRTLLLLLGTLLFLACGRDEAYSGTQAGAVLLIVPQNAQAATLSAADELSVYLTALLGSTPSRALLPLAAGQDGVVAAQRRQRAGLTIVLDAHLLAVPEYADARVAGLPEGGYLLGAEHGGDFSNRLDGGAGGTLVYLASASGLGIRYAVYELLRRLGVRFYHPEQEYVPRLPAHQVQARAATPTVESRRDSKGQVVIEHVPDYAQRGYTFHGSHPLEHLESFSDSSHPIDEARNANLWILKNRGNRFRGPGRGVAPESRRKARADELNALRISWGMPSTAGITLHNQQQGASAVVDLALPEPPQQQIEDYVDAQLEAAGPDLAEFGIHFGPTEVTVTPDQQTVDWINWAGRRVLSRRPDLPVSINNHITGSQPTEHFGDLGCPTGTNESGYGDYYDLSFHTDPRLGVRVHTVMFYPLEGPAHVYNQKTFAHKLCLMERASAQGRPLVYFPEGSWWLSFDNPVPVYLPLYMWARKRDIDLVQPLLTKSGGSLDGHRMFNSGHEWGYWQQDYAVGLLHWNSDVSLDQVLDELVEPFCPAAAWPKGCPAATEAKAVLGEMIEYQRDTLLEKPRFGGKPGGLFTYLAGEEPGDEIAAATGFEFRPVRTSFSSVLSWDKKTLTDFRFSDQKALIEMDDTYTDLADRLSAVRAQVPKQGLPWFDELVDGTEINQQRVRQAEALYDAVVAFREDTLKHDADPSAPDPSLRAKEKLARAETALAEAGKIIARREAQYRYPAEQVFGGGLTPETAVANGTTYPYRVHTKTHLLTFWNNRQLAAREIIEGKAASGTELLLHPVLAAPGTPLSVVWPQIPGLAGKLQLGDGTEIDPKVTSHNYPGGAAVYTIGGALEADGNPLPVSGHVVRSDHLARSTQGGFALTKPESQLAKDLLGSLVPRIWLARVGGQLVLIPETRSDGKLDFTRVTVAPLASDAGALQTEAFTLLLPIVAPGGTAVAAEVRAQKLVVSVGSGLDGVAKLAGQLVLADVVQALIVLAGFDQKGALETLSGILGFDPQNPPELLDFQADLSLELPAP